MSDPIPFADENQISALQNVEFVDLWIDQLLNRACIKEVDAAPYICSPLTVVESSTKNKTLVINIGRLNVFLFKEKCRFEDLRMAMLLLTA